MPPNPKLSPAVIAALPGGKRNASPPNPPLSEDNSVRRPEPAFTPLDEILGTRSASVSPPVSTTWPDQQLNLPTIGDVWQRMPAEKQRATVPLAGYPTIHRRASQRSPGVGGTTQFPGSRYDAGSAGTNNSTGTADVVLSSLPAGSWHVPGIMGLAGLYTGHVSKPSTAASPTAATTKPRTAGSSATYAPYGFVARNQWTKSPPIPKLLVRIDRPYTEIVFHDTSTKQTPQSVYDLHVNGNGWGDVGYHYMIDRNGKIYAGRNLVYEGAHVSGHNPGKIGIAFLGDYTTQDNTRAQIDSAGYLVDELSRRFPTINRLSNHGMYDIHRNIERGMSSNYQLERKAIEKKMYWGPDSK
jgi:hypothetical protein